MAVIEGMDQPLVLGAGEKGDAVILDPSRFSGAKAGGGGGPGRRFKFAVDCEKAERHSPRLKESGEAAAHYCRAFATVTPV